MKLNNFSLVSYSAQYCILILMNEMIKFWKIHSHGGIKSFLCDPQTEKWGGDLWRERSTNKF
jgi:hypothetical protein